MAYFYRSDLLDQHPQSIHAVTTKTNGLEYEGSLALHTGEKENKIIQNRSYIAKVLGLGNEFHFITAQQTHSDHIEVIKETKTLGWHRLEDAVADCDALITDQKGVVLTILTADCVPILLLDPKKGVVAAVHAGWRGTEAGIAGKTVKKMVETFGSNPKEIVAFVAPSIGRCCYEVGEDVAKHFKAIERAYDEAGEKYMLDLPLINQKQLLDAGLKESNIELSGQCTSCEVDRYFSYRKEQGCSGRFMSMIGLKP
jgi:YfiH family protein